ncbi:MAG: hypothetical protein ACI9A1_001757, partial [Lentimonas sp.]
RAARTDRKPHPRLASSAVAVTFQLFRISAF